MISVLHSYLQDVEQVNTDSNWKFCEKEDSEKIIKGLFMFKLH